MTVERVYEMLYSHDTDTLILRKSDGSHIKAFSMKGQARAFFKYNYSSVENPPPNTGQIRTNAPDAPDITEVWIHRKDADSRDQKNFLMSAAVGDTVYFQDINNADTYGTYTVSEDAIDNDNYVTLKLGFVKSSLVPLEGSGILIGIVK